MRLSGGLACSALVALAACGVRYGFSVGGLPTSVRSIAVTAFENKTTSGELAVQVAEVMRPELRRRLGLRDASQETADAVVSGTIQQYQPDMPVGVSADPTQVSARRRLQITVDVRVEVGGSVWLEKRGLMGSADYAERGEPQARRQAIESLVNELTTAIQSKW